MSNKNPMSLYAKPDHKRMSKALGYALTLDNDEGWEGFTLLACARLTEAERAVLAWAVLMAMEPDNVVAVAKNVIGAADYPMPPYLDPLDDARHWAECANDEELRAYALAIFEAMSAPDRRDFVNFTREAA